MKQEQYRRVVAENRLKMSKAAHSKKLSNTHSKKIPDVIIKDLS